MICKQILDEYGRKRPCWLPADPSSHFEFCRRCHFDKVTELLDSIRQCLVAGRETQDYEILTQPFFLDESLHLARHQALISLLSVLFEKKRPLFDIVLAKLKDKRDFQLLSEKLILQHTCGSRCFLYRHLMKTYGASHEKLDCCWHCIAWILRFTKTEKYMKRQGRNILHALGVLTLTTLQTYGLDTFMDIMTSLHIYEHTSLIGMFFFHLEAVLGRDNVESFLLRFYSQPPLLDFCMAKKLNAYMPPEWNKEKFCNAAYDAAKKTIKDRLSIFQEELMERAWHPDRVVRWCMDVKELHGFRVS